MSHTRAEALRTTNWVPQIGSKFARLACGTNRSVRAAAPCDNAGLARLPVAENVIVPQSDFRMLLRSIVPALPGPIARGVASISHLGPICRRHKAHAQKEKIYSMDEAA